MKRREMLLTAGAAVVGLSALPLRWAAAAEKKQKLLYFTRSAGFVHSVVNRQGKSLAWSEKILTELGEKHGIEVVCSQDGAVFDGDLDQFDAFAFYTSGNLAAKGEHPQPGQPMSAEGKKRLLAAVAAGKGFVGIHAAADSFRLPGASDRSLHRHAGRRVPHPPVAAEGHDEGGRSEVSGHGRAWARASR